MGAARVAIGRVMLGTAAWGMMVAGITAQEAAPPAVSEPWQAVITSQIEAFRAKDAPGAFRFASAYFQSNFSSAETFFVSIIGSGYAPIMESRSHSFGAFRRVDENVVVQEVKLVGTDQSLYEAFYQLGQEEAGWRVQGVQLVKQPGLGI